MGFGVLLFDAEDGAPARLLSELRALPVLLIVPSSSIRRKSVSSMVFRDMSSGFCEPANTTTVLDPTPAADAEAEAEADADADAEEEAAAAGDCACCAAGEGLKTGKACRDKVTSRPSRRHNRVYNIKTKSTKTK